MISKKILEAVLGYKVKLMPKNTSLNPRGVDIVYMLDINYPKASKIKVKSINLYELAHKCKEWVLDEGYWITIGIGATTQLVLTSKGTTILDSELYRIEDKDLTEHEAVFKACEWILKQKDNL